MNRSETEEAPGHYDTIQFNSVNTIASEIILSAAVSNKEIVLD